MNGWVQCISHLTYSAPPICTHKLPSLSHDVIWMCTYSRDLQWLVAGNWCSCCDCPEYLASDSWQNNFCRHSKGIKAIQDRAGLTAHYRFLESSWPPFPSIRLSDNSPVTQWGPQGIQPIKCSWDLPSSPRDTEKSQIAHVCCVCNSLLANKQMSTEMMCCFKELTLSLSLQNTGVKTYIRLGIGF